ncbi:MAG: thioredoxin-disulfide reductase [Candidatus Omnitrophica bacterium]|nr:thioredoxin-disulfide reductase [Candidatus Omnitrophota bacterium]
MADKTYDTIIIGAGGAGLTAAIYTARSLLSTLIFEKASPGGQISTTDIVENYPGFPKGVTGGEISSFMEEQAKHCGAEFVYDEVLSVKKEKGSFLVASSERSYKSLSLILACGSSPRKLNVPGEKEFSGKGVSYCATCDGPLYKNKQIAIVGGGDSAIQETLYLTRFAERVTVIHRRDKLRASILLQKRAFSNPKISFLWDSVVTAVEGSKVMERLKVKNVKTGSESFVRSDGLFVFIGHDPETSFLKGFVDMDEAGYVIVNDKFETSQAGVFACGEVRHGATKQLVACSGEGCIAALASEKYLDEQNPRGGMK